MMEGPLTALVRDRLRALARADRGLQSRVAARLGIEASGVNKAFRIDERPITLKFLEAVVLESRTPVRLAELVAPEGTVKQLDADEAALLRYVRKWPKPVLHALIAFLHYWADEEPSVTLSRNHQEYFRRLNATDQQRVHGFAVMLQEKALGPDQIALLLERVGDERQAVQDALTKQLRKAKRDRR